MNDNTFSLAQSLGPYKSFAMSCACVQQASDLALTKFCASAAGASFCLVEEIILYRASSRKHGHTNGKSANAEPISC